MTKETSDRILLTVSVVVLVALFLFMFLVPLRWMWNRLARAGLVADHENYPAIRSFLLWMREKYPQYEPSDLVKAEIKARPR